MGVGGCRPGGITERVGKAGFGDTKHASPLHISEHPRGTTLRGLAMRGDGGQGGEGEEAREGGTERKGGRGRRGRIRKIEMKGGRERDPEEVGLQWDVPKVGGSSPRHSGPGQAGKSAVAGCSSFQDS